METRASRTGGDIISGLSASMMLDSPADTALMLVGDGASFITRGGAGDGTEAPGSRRPL